MEQGMIFELNAGDIKSIINLVVSWAMLSAGHYKIFEKCGIRSIWAFVPFVREYKTSLCAYREKDGRYFTVFRALGLALGYIPYLFLEEDSRAAIIFAIITLAALLASVIYSIRIHIGLCEIFHRRKLWVLGFLIFEGVSSIIWGFVKSFQPEKKAYTAEDTQGARVTGVKVDSTQDGLTVNIQERTAIDFFKKKVLLKDIHCIIPKGHMVLLLGGSGAGKTTFVNAVTGYEKADASVLMDGRDIYAEYDKMKYDVGFVPQQDLMRTNDTVFTTLSDAASLRLPSSVQYAERKRRIQEVLDEFGLSAIKWSLVEKLSGGQRKRLSISMEFISDPTLFILDEPDSGLDGVVARSLFEKLRAIADSGKIVMVITHTPDRVIDLFDDVIVLAKDGSRTGRMAYYGTVEDARAFFGKESMEEILLAVNQKEEGGDGRADEFIEKYAEQLLSGTEGKAG